MSARKPAPSACPLPVAITQLARGLIRLHARLRGELAKAREGEEVLVDGQTAAATMAHIEAVVRFLGVNFVPSAVKPIRTRPKIGPLAFGDLQAGMLAALRAAGGWMTYSAVVEAILDRNNLTLTASQHRHFLRKLREAAHCLKVKGAIECESAALELSQTGTRQRWRLSARLFRGD